jgi:tetratricopeptide (TPR) repeat protein
MKSRMCREESENLPEWDPPAPSTVYIKIKDIPYETFKTRLNQGLVTTELDQIRYRLERHFYCCQVCSKYVNGYCIKTNRKAGSGWICKSFVPKEEYIYINSRPGQESQAGFRYLSDTGLRKGNIQNEDQESQNPESAGAGDLYEEGVTLYRQGRLRLAIQAFDQVLSKDSQHFAAIFHKGNALLKLKSYEEALEAFEKASRINSCHSGLWTNKGFVFLKLERFQTALEAFEKSISLNPVQKNAWDGKDAVLSRILQCKEGLKEFEKVLDTNPSDTSALFEKGKLHLKLGELEQSRGAFEKALETKPENADAWQLRGKILFEMGLEKEALHSFEKATRHKPDFPEAWYEKGLVFLRSGNLKGAENAFKIAADLWESKGLKNKAEIARQRVKKLGSSRD